MSDKPSCFGDVTEYNPTENADCRFKCQYRYDCQLKIKKESQTFSTYSRGFAPTATTPNSTFSNQPFPPAQPTASAQPNLQMQPATGTAVKPLNNNPVGLAIQQDTPAEKLMKHVVSGALAAVGYEIHKFFVGYKFGSEVVRYLCGSCKRDVTQGAIYCANCGSKIR